MPPVRTIIDEPVHTPGATIVVDSVGGGIPMDVPGHNIGKKLDWGSLAFSELSEKVNISH